MKTFRTLNFIFIILFVFSTVAFGQKKSKKLKNYSDSLSYAIGIEMAKEIKDNLMLEEDNFNLKSYIKGFSAYYENKDLQFDKDSTYDFLGEYFTMKSENAKRELIQECEDFLQENRKKPGIIETESGLQYEVLKSGDGAMPIASSKVKVHYTGSLMDGTKFDSSYDRGEPVVFGVGQVIKGWTEALQLMHVGDKWKIYIPSELGYGENGAGDVIPPFSVLIFEVELLGIE